MTHRHLSNLLRALMVTTVLVALTTPTVAFAEGSAGGQPADAFERYAAAHPYGASSVEPAADVFERYAAAHARSALTDRRSPDTRDLTDVADVSQAALADRRSPDTRDIADNPQPTLADRRSPDTIDSAARVSNDLPIQVTTLTHLGKRGSFDWGDAGIGATAAVLILGLLAGLMLLLPLRPHRRQPAHTT